MAQTIKLKRSATPGAVPTTAALSLGEMAINTYDGKVYIKKDAGAESVVEVGADQTPAELLTAIKTVDGSGSGLDADLLDGQQGSYYLNTSTKLFKSGAEIAGSQDLNTYRTTGYYAQDSNADATSGSNYPVVAAGILEVITGDQGNGLQTEQRYSQYNTNDKYVRHYYNGNWTAWAKQWTSANDGSGSGLDADLLDGVQGSSFLRSDIDDTMAGDLLMDSANAEINLKSGAAGTAGAINWTFNTTGTNYGSISLPYDTRASAGLIVDSGYPITLNAQSEMKFITGGIAERMRITSAGFVGIGTTSPLARLDVESGTGNVGFNYGTLASPSRGNLWYDTDGTGWQFNIGKVQSGAFTSQVTLQDNGRVGIGTTTPLADLDVRNNISMGDGTSATNLSMTRNSANYISASNAAGYLVFRTGGAVERMRINSSGNVGIGTTSPSGLLDLTTTSTTSLDIQGGDGNSKNIVFRKTTGGAQQAKISVIGDDLRFTTGPTTERMRIDSSGNLSILGGDIYVASGNIGGSGGAGYDVYMSSGTGVNGNGLRCTNYISTNSAIPCRGDGASTDNVMDLGTSGSRFDDIYATNGTIQTSDLNEKQEIAELSDAEQRVAVACKGLLRKFRWKDSVAEKGDDARIHFGIIAQDLQAAFAAEGLDAGDYAMFISTTWTDEETNEEKTRMGVRYSELLAFIIAAL